MKDFEESEGPSKRHTFFLLKTSLRALVRLESYLSSFDFVLGKA